MRLLLLGVLFALAVKAPMPTFSTMEEVGRFLIPCEQSDPFIVVVQTFRDGEQHEGLFDRFLLTYHAQDKDEDSRPFMALSTDGKHLFVHEWLDMNRDGIVDVENSLEIDTTDGFNEIVDHICKTARLLR